ncbi:MAG: hypothetical protein GX587_06405 [Bacteroidales bacterium]|nr:hypothetical protein [Bacteroidales bacterium]
MTAMSCRFDPGSGYFRIKPLKCDVSKAFFMPFGKLHAHSASENIFNTIPEYPLNTTRQIRYPLKINLGVFTL